MESVLPIILEVLLKMYLQFADKCWNVTLFWWWTCLEFKCNIRMLFLFHI